MEDNHEKDHRDKIPQELYLRYDQDLLLRGEDLIDRRLCVYPGKIKNIPDYSVFAGRLINCGLLVRNSSRGGKMTCICTRYDEETRRVYITKDNFQAAWPMLKRGATLGIRQAKENGTECSIHTPDEIVCLDYLQRSGSDPVLEHDQIVFRAKESSPEERRLIAARQSALDAQKNIYFYSKVSGCVHDRQCEQVKKIPLEEFAASDRLPEGREYCPHCGRMIFIRIGCAPNTKEIPICNRIFIQYGVKTSQIGRFVMEKGMRFHARSLSEMTVRCGEDTWIIRMNAGGLTLWHNNYVRTSDTERYITDGFHKQGLKKKLSMHQMLLYITDYSWQKHLAAQQEKVPEAVPVSIPLPEYPAEKPSFWRRLTAYVQGLLFRR